MQNLLLSSSAIHFTSCSTARNPHAFIYIQKWCTHIKWEPNFIRERRSYFCSYNALHSPAPTRRHTTIYMLKNVSVSLSHLYCYGLRSLSCTLKLLVTCQKDTGSSTNRANAHMYHPWSAPACTEDSNGLLNFTVL